MRGLRLTVLVEVGQVDLITKQHHPLAELDGSHDDSVGGPAVLTVVVKRLQEELGGRRAREVEAYDLGEGEREGGGGGGREREEGGGRRGRRGERKGGEGGRRGR